MLIPIAMPYATDYTPDAIAWSDPSGAAPGPIYTDTQTFTGFNRTITLRFNITAGSLGWAYNKNASGFVGFGDEDTLTISPGNTLQFLVAGLAGSGTLEVRNASDGDAVLYTVSAILF